MRTVHLVREVEKICMNPGLVVCIDRFRGNAVRAKKLEKLYGIMLAHSNERAGKIVSVWKDLPDLRDIDKKKRMLATINKAL